MASFCVANALRQGTALQLAEKFRERGFVTGHGLSRAENAANDWGLQPLRHVFRRFS
jgi:hypothetical protein